MVNQSKKNDPRFWKKWKEFGAIGDKNGRDIGEAYAFFDCNASIFQVAEEILFIRTLVKTPKRLELFLAEKFLPIISYNGLDSELCEITRDATEANIRYVLAARSPPNITNRQTADEVATILNQAYQSPLYQEGEPFTGAVVFKEKDNYIFRE